MTPAERDAVLEEAAACAKEIARAYDQWSRDAAAQVDLNGDPAPDYALAASFATKCAGALGASFAIRSLKSGQKP